MTKTAAIKAINAMGLSARATHCGTEIRITYRLTDSRLMTPAIVGPITRKLAIDRAEAVAYYTPDPQDAYDTAVMMARKVTMDKAIEITKGEK